MKLNTINDKMQKNYTYVLSATYGRRGFEKGFNPYFTPKQILDHGAFEGKYLNDCKNEFPKSWFRSGKFSLSADPSVNYFNCKSRQSLQEWRRKKWIFKEDPRGWFQWYCRYYMGRRVPEMDMIQIKRWKAFVRHAGQIKKNCKPQDLSCRPKQRQALLQWGHNPFI